MHFFFFLIDFIDCDLLRIIDRYILLIRTVYNVKKNAMKIVYLIIINYFILDNSVTIITSRYHFYFNNVLSPAK